MTAQFAYTSFFVSYVNRGDENHKLAYKYLTRSAIPLVTSDWVLTELGNYLCETRNRRLFAPLVEHLRSEHRVTVIEATRELFDQGLDLYSRRRDKDRSMTDCMSFVIMKDQGIMEALTADHHFTQAGFTILLK